MNIRAAPFWVPKQGNSEEEYEDAVWPHERREYHEEARVCLAIADGATESLYARRWAECLVGAVGEGQLSLASLGEGIRSLQAEWQESMAGKALPWYAEEKLRQGAFAAFVVLEILEEPGSRTSSQDSSSVGHLEMSLEEPGSGTRGLWRAAALGDSCLFHIRGEEVLARFPVDHSTGFNSRPRLLGTMPAKGGPDPILHRGGRWAKGDTFYLMTDALASWFLTEIEAGCKPWIELQRFSDGDKEAVFADWIATLRERASIRNDDCTLLNIDIC